MDSTSEKTIFLEAVELTDTTERKRFLETACGEDDQLRRNVQALLAANDDEEHPLEKLAIDRLQKPSQAGCQELLGTRISGYRLDRMIGEGGFGLVFLAKQETPVRRDVALKIIKPGSGTNEVIARFEAEKQAVAMMDHPNIARIFDAGVSQDSRPFFVMELVRGIPVTSFADQRGLTLDERLRLFIDVCSAVHHAHQKGVIHRDLKPSNVMVTSDENQATVKVIDFGISKAIGHTFNSETVQTQAFSLIGTPLYMSPEQADMNGMDVDTRSDVYSLGVLLYELLTGVPPFDRQRIESAGIDELRRIIREEVPLLPSKRLFYPQLSQAETKQARSRMVKPASLRGDLDWIVMKAIEKDRSRRYESATALADDLNRFLDGQTVTARPPSMTYVLSKFAGRHRVALLTGAFLLATLITTTAISVRQWRQAAWERDQKEQALFEAQSMANRLVEASSLIASGQIHLNARRWKQAKSDFDEAIALQPGYTDPWANRGKFYIELRLWKEAAADYARALEFRSTIQSPQWWGVAGLLEWTGQEQAAKDFHKRLQESLQRNSGRTPPTDYSWEFIRNSLATDEGYAQQARDFIADQAERKLRELMSEFDDRQGRQSKATEPRRGIGSNGNRNARPICQHITGVALLRA
ncbi:MAG: serine/threonine-protein kinase, partial [Planctomycetota bacterium]